MNSSEGFQHHFNIISKFVCCGCYMKKNVAFTLFSFAVLKWDECLSVQLPLQLLLELEAKLLDQNENLNYLECRWNQTLVPMTCNQVFPVTQFLSTFPFYQKSTFPFYQKGMYELFMLLLEKEWKYQKTPIWILSSAKSPAQNVNYEIRVCTEKTWLKQLFKDQDIILLSL